MKKAIFILCLVLISIPSFSKMLRFGIYSMQDFHYFRLVEFDKCITDLQIPCRWSADAGLGYGEPVFNFYGQIPYVLGALFHRVGFAFTDSLKITFAFSLIASGVAMFFFSRKIWKSSYAGLISAVFYMYAPYRAVDVWVRGALPEALSFVLFPLILLSVEIFIEKQKKVFLVSTSILLAILILTHNLSVILFSPVLVGWCIYRLISTKKTKLFVPIGIAALSAILISFFYLLPVIFESFYINLDSTTKGYFDFRGHFAGLYQLFLSNYWGFGGSVFGPEDGLSLSVGYLHWVLPLAMLLIVLLTRKVGQYKSLAVFLLLGMFCLFLTHNKSTLIWTTLPFMKYIQFPWRFLGVAVFCLSVSSGAIANIFKRKVLLIVAIVSVAVVCININFFKEDIWIEKSDLDLTTGTTWEEQTRASIGDYWPKDKQIPTDFAPSKTDDFELIEKKSNRVVYKVLLEKKDIVFPINYFPGWTKNTVDNQVTFVFADTPVRVIGNIISIASVVILFIWASI